MGAEGGNHHEDGVSQLALFTLADRPDGETRTRSESVSVPLKKLWPFIGEI
jgi:hypothetical protein